MRTVFFLFSLFLGAGAAELKDDEYFSLPKLFHLDDYERCLSRSDGVYCQGTFQVSAGRPNSTFDLMEAYSDTLHFNHTYLHRGYCVSSRCPSPISSSSPYLRFSHCISQWGKRRDLHLRLHKLEYCTTHQEHVAKAWVMGEPQKLFLWILGAILLMNVVGTLHDAAVEDNKKYKLLAAWSITSNWKLMTHTFEDKEQATFAPMQGFRVVTFALITFGHTLATMALGYIDNSHTFGQLFQGPLGMVMSVGAVVVQTYILMSSFLAAYHLLLKCREKPVGFGLLPKMLLRRIIRIGPTTYLLVTFAYTWWSQLGDGPQWQSIVGAENKVCSRKYWWQIMFVNNLVEPREFCITPTWFLAADMQLYVVTVILTLILARYRAHAVRILFALILGTTVMISGLAYIMEWKSVLYETHPELARNTCRYLPHFPFYISPGGGIQASLTGMLLAFVQISIREQGGFKIDDHKWMVYAFNAVIPLGAAWSQVGFLLKTYETRLVTAAFFGLERPLMLVFCGLAVFGSINVDCTARRIFSWRGWAVLARASLPYMLVHWILLISLTAARVQPLYYTVFGHVLESITGFVVGFMISIPISLLAEIPIQRALATILL